MRVIIIRSSLRMSSAPFRSSSLLSKADTKSETRILQIVAPSLITDTPNAFRVCFLLPRTLGYNSVNFTLRYTTQVHPKVACCNLFICAALYQFSINSEASKLEITIFFVNRDFLNGSSRIG